VIIAISKLKNPGTPVKVFTDSKYVSDAGKFTSSGATKRS